MIKAYIKRKLGLLLWVEKQKIIQKNPNAVVLKEIEQIEKEPHLNLWRKYDELLAIHAKAVKISLIDKSPE
ncbi:MAG: hypothetical protein IJ870_01130 [Alphaproteobacteria bacterium]|nr:hypothetical protein [Alphaproteobacteria bacterium]